MIQKRKVLMISLLVLCVAAVITVPALATIPPVKIWKTVETFLERTFEWDISKSASHSSLILSEGQRFDVTYTLTLDRTSSDSGWSVGGHISVWNRLPVPILVNEISDTISPDGIDVTDIDCIYEVPYTLPAGWTILCAYSADLSSGSPRTNEASTSVELPSGPAVFSTVVDFDFSGANVTSIDECVTVSDDKFGDLGTVCEDKMLTYILEVGPYPACGTYEFINIASLTTNDTSTSRSDSWTVDVSVPCGGCTLTPGYWKTHSEFGPAPYDDTWALLSGGAGTAFFWSGQTYYDVLWTSARGNAYYILARAYIAAELNELNGADFGAAQAAFDAAETLFSDPENTPENVGNLKGSERNEWINLAEILDDYNNGVIGPGHCSE